MLQLLHCRGAMALGRDQSLRLAIPRARMSARFEGEIYEAATHYH